MYENCQTNQREKCQDHESRLPDVDTRVRRLTLLLDMQKITLLTIMSSTRRLHIVRRVVRPSVRPTVCPSSVSLSVGGWGCELSVMLQSLLSVDALTGSVSVRRKLNRDVVHRMSRVVVAHDYISTLSSTGTSLCLSFFLSLFVYLCVCDSAYCNTAHRPIQP